MKTKLIPVSFVFNRIKDRYLIIIIFIQILNYFDLTKDIRI